MKVLSTGSDTRWDVDPAGTAQVQPTPRGVGRRWEVTVVYAALQVTCRLAVGGLPLSLLTDLTYVLKGVIIIIADMRFGAV